MGKDSQDRKIKAIEAEIGQLQRRLDLHQGSADSIRRQIAKLTEKRKSFAKRGGCPCRNLEQKFTAGGIVFICAECGNEVLDVPVCERDIVADSYIRDLTHR